MKRAIGIVSRMITNNRPTVRIGEIQWIIGNDYAERWSLGQAVLVRYHPQDQFATIIDPETLEKL